MASISHAPEITGVVVVEPKVFGDSRGRFVETYRRSWFDEGREMVQGNRSEKEAGAIVGLHYHLHQADYWYVMRGLITVVLHDLRVGSQTQHNTMTLELDGGTERGVFIPPGVAHGFATREDSLLTYLVDSYYNPEDELGLAFDDPDLGIEWKIDDPVVSDRDRNNPRRTEIPEGRRPYWGLRK